jgi:hypothetical protein
MERVIRKIVRIDRSFRLADRSNLAGDYEVTTEEQQLGDLMFEAFRRISTRIFRRISTRIYLPPSDGRTGIGDFVEIDPRQLEILMKPESGEPARGLKGPEEC